MGVISINYKFSPIEQILQDYLKNTRDIETVQQIKKLIPSNSVGTIEYDVADSWLHIKEIETNFFNSLTKINIPKELFNNLMEKEEEVYKVGIGSLKNKFKEIKIWTITTLDKANNKDFAIYKTLPPKLGFKLIPIEKFELILNLRKIIIDTDFLKNNNKIWWANNTTLKEEKLFFKDTINEYLRS